MPRAHPRAHRDKTTLAKRPTETVAGLGGIAVTYGFLTQAGMPPLPAAILAVVAGLVPAVVTLLTDHVDGRE